MGGSVNPMTCISEDINYCDFITNKSKTPNDDCINAPLPMPGQICGK